MSTVKIATYKLALAYASWWVLLITIETYALITTFDLRWQAALADAVTINLLLAAAGHAMHNALKYYQPGAKNSLSMTVWSIGLAALCVFVHRCFMRYAFADDTVYLDYMNGSYIIRGLFSWLMIALMSLMSWMWYYMQDQRASETREQDAQKMAREAELASLRQQLQPHFLFNSLNSISALAGSRPEEARKMIQQLSDFLRGTIRRDDQQIVTLEEELNHLQLYLEIEKVRFGHRLRTEVQHDAEALALRLPSLLLQPIVENAIKFGLYDTTGEITIRISATVREGQMLLSVENPFDPTTAQPRRGTGFGLNSVQRRLYLLYARNDLLTTEQHETEENPRFITHVKIPQNS